MKKIYLLLFLATAATVARAQNFVIADNTTVKKCYTVEAMEEARRNNPRAETDAQFESWINNMIQQRKSAQSDPTARLNVVNNYNLPIIFHIISNGEAVGTMNNISAALITQQMLQINKDYANKSNSPYAVSSNTGLQFFLAQKNEAGTTLAEPGIDRINRSTYGWTDPTAGWTTTYITTTVKPGSIWDATKYLNVWLVPLIPGTISGTEILGYATFPTSSTLAGLDNSETAATAGVVIKTITAGSVFQPSLCSNANTKGRTLTHELGHFFGLRHIWGDANCATDYVDDTPVHFTSNSGMPQHPKPNSCGTPDEMFENYMDYSDDIIANTFTVNQVDRMQTVMLYSPRRVSLPASTAGFIPVTATNRIAFNDCSGAMNVSEGGATGTYPRTRNINLYLDVESQATGTATVTLTTGGTAVINKDYTINPVVTFASGDTYKPITLTILDNASVEADRTIILTYTISGTGVTAGTTSQSETITILDNDNYVVGQNTVNALAEGFENGAGTYGLPSGWGLLTTMNYVNRYVTSANGDAGGSGKAAHITNEYVLRPNIYTKGIAGAAILQSPVIDPARYVSLGALSFKYKVAGSVNDNTILTYNYSTQVTGPFYYYGAAGFNGYGPYYSTTATPVSGTSNPTTPTATSNSKFSIDFYWQTTATLTGNDPGFNVDDVVFTAQPFNVETAVSSSYGYDIPTATVNNFKSTNNKAIASVSALSVPVTNLTAAVTEAGTDRPGFAANGTTYLRSRKVISVSPSPNSATAQYTVKLYYTAAELAAWSNIMNLKIMKVNTGVSLSSPLNNSNAVIVTPSLVEDSIASRGYAAFTATFTGFSQFVLVESNAVLPVKLLSFTGILDKSRAKLNWKTADEINNKGFEIERSTDAIAFEKIGWVDATTTNSYELYDATIVKGNTYYYRLKQIDKDGNYTYSPVIRITYTGENAISIFPNPIKNNLVIQQSGTGRTSVVITDLTGKTIYSTTFAAGSLNVNATTWSKGIYLVRVFNNDDVSTFKVVKQ